jgi:uncharacterized protein YunC (DUF1805 family)
MIEMENISIAEKNTIKIGLKMKLPSFLTIKHTQKNP